MREAVRHFRVAGGGIIISMSSWAAQQGSAIPQLTAYASTKAAIKAMTQTLARAHVEPRVRLVDLHLEPVDILLLDLEAGAVRPREIRTDVEELVLDPFQAGGAPADDGVELVDVAERGDARIELRDARAVAEARLPRVAAARVDLRQADGLVTVPHPRSLR